MLWQCKRQQSGEVPRTVFVCHRVPFLIPQAPAMPGGAACGGGSWCKARLRRFSLPLSEWRWGGWAARKPVWFLKSRTPCHERVHALHCLPGLREEIFSKFFVIIMCLEWKRLSRESHMNWSAGTEYKGEVSPVLSWSGLVKDILSLKAWVNKKDVILLPHTLALFWRAAFKLATSVNGCGKKAFKMTPPAPHLCYLDIVRKVVMFSLAWRIWSVSPHWFEDQVR